MQNLNSEKEKNMKKYIKPELYYESFEVSQNVAACDWDMSNLKDKFECSAQGEMDPTDFLFVDSNDRCTITPDLIEDYCYENSTSGISVFNS